MLKQIQREQSSRQLLANHQGMHALLPHIRSAARTLSSMDWTILAKQPAPDYPLPEGYRRTLVARSHRAAKRVEDAADTLRRAVQFIVAHYSTLCQVSRQAKLLCHTPREDKACVSRANTRAQHPLRARANRSTPRYMMRKD